MQHIHIKHKASGDCWCWQFWWRQHYHWLCGSTPLRRPSCISIDPSPRWRCTPSPANWAQNPAYPEKELTSGDHAQSGWSLESHAWSGWWECRCQRRSCDCSVVELPTLHRPQHWEVIAVAHSSWVCKTGSPQAGPVPGHLDDRGASHTPYGAYFPSFHGHSAGNKNPSQNSHQEPPNLDDPGLHRVGVSSVF